MTRPMGLVGYLRYFGDMALCSPIEASWGRGTAVILPSGVRGPCISDLERCSGAGDKNSVNNQQESCLKTGLAAGLLRMHFLKRSDAQG